MGEVEFGGHKYLVYEDTDYDTYLVLFGSNLNVLLGTYANRALALKAIDAHSKGPQAS
jgi:hypothetical protein